jgi:hypothetical protein
MGRPVATVNDKISNKELENTFHICLFLLNYYVNIFHISSLGSNFTGTI